MGSSSSFFQDTNTTPSASPSTPQSTANSDNCSSLFQDTNPTPIALETVDTLVTTATVTAQSAATNAASSATSAALSASGASTSATNAASSVTAAAGSASDASGYATTASNQVPLAAAQVTLATAQVSLATTQAGNATTSAGNALTYSNNASASATLAANYATGFSIGTVTTGPVAATITGSPGSQHLNLTMPATTITAPTSSVLGGVFSSSAGANQFATGINTTGNITYAQPSFSNISGSVAAAQLPTATVSAQGALPVLSGSTTQYLNGAGAWGTVTPYTLPAPTASTLGGVQSQVVVSQQFMTGISTAGVPTTAQPAFTDISGTIDNTQIPPPGGTLLGGVYSRYALTGQCVNGVGPTGYPSYITMPVGFRNRLHNGDMQIAERGFPITCTAASLTYTLDRWLVYATGAAVSATQVDGPTGFSYAMQITGATGNTLTQLVQRIEAAHCVDLVGKAMMVQATINASAGQTVIWTLQYATALNNFRMLTSIASGSWTVTTTATVFSASIAALPAGAANGLVLFIIPQNGGAFTTGTISVTGVQLELGTIITAFEQLPVSIERSLCQRYYQKLGGSSVADICLQSYAASAGITVAMSFALPVTMRTAPTATLIGSWSGNNATSVALYAGANTATLQVTATAAGAVGLFTGSAANYITLSADL